ncbi:MAG: surface-adhesin E family protein [Pseudomonadota bacterium]
MRLLIAAAVAATCIATPAAAQSWYRVAGNDDTVHYVDASTIVTKNGKTMVWTQTVFREPINDVLVSARIQSEYTCANNSFRTIEYVYYGAGGKFLGKEPSETIDEVRHPGPGSIDASILKYVCTREGGVKVASPLADSEGYFAQ